MPHLYERPVWVAQAEGLDKSSYLFCLIVNCFGVLGVLLSIVMFILSFIMINEGGLIGMGASGMLLVQSVVLIAFGTMMRGISKVIIAIFEMSLSETREHIEPSPSQ